MRRLGQPRQVGKLASVGHLDPAMGEREVLREKRASTTRRERVGAERLGQAKNQRITTEHGKHPLAMKERGGAEELSDTDGHQSGE